MLNNIDDKCGLINVKPLSLIKENMEIFVENKDNCYNYRNLFAAIINQAIKDGLLYKCPRPSQRRGFTKAKKLKLMTLYVWCIKVINKRCDYPISVVNFCMKFIINYFNLKMIKRKCTCSNENLAYEGRKYLSHTNSDLELYCRFLELDSNYLEMKAKRYFNRFDYHSYGNKFHFK